MRDGTTRCAGNRVHHLDDMNAPGAAIEAQLPSREPESSGTAEGGILIRELSYVHGGKLCVLDRFNAHFRPDEISVIVGKSGCGKTTLLKLIAGLIPLPRGSQHITIGDQPAAHAQEKRLLGYLSQDSNPAYWLTAFENLIMVLKFAGYKREDRVPLADRLLSELDIQDLRGRYPSTFSGGQRRKLAMAMAVVASPSYILLDEPFSAVDAIGRVALYRFLFSLWSQIRSARAAKGGKTSCAMIVVTHDINEASLLGDRIFIFGKTPIVGATELENVALDKRNTHPTGAWWFTEEHRELSRRIYESLNATSLEEDC